MVNHRAFDWDRLLDKFPGHEAILVSHVKSWGAGLDIDATFDDFLFKKQTIELVETLRDLGNGMVLAFEVKHGLPVALEIELGKPSEVDACRS
jgi:hypothetical protein